MRGLCLQVVLSSVCAGVPSSGVRNVVRVFRCHVNGTAWSLLLEAWAQVRGGEAGWAVEGQGIMKVASLYDGSAWALVNPDILAGLQKACTSTAVKHHQRLLASYASQGPGQPGRHWAEVPDDGYILQNLGHHLVCADRLMDLRALLANPAWLETKLLAYGTAAVVADFRRCARPLH